MQSNNCDDFMLYDLYESANTYMQDVPNKHPNKNYSVVFDSSVSSNGYDMYNWFIDDKQNISLKNYKDTKYPIYEHEYSDLKYNKDMDPIEDVYYKCITPNDCYVDNNFRAINSKNKSLNRTYPKNDQDNYPLINYITDKSMNIGYTYNKYNMNDLIKTPFALTQVLS